MPDPIRTWTIDINQAFSDLIQINQYRESALAFHDLLVAAGWTIVQSFNGVAIQTTGVSNWLTTADVIFGTQGNGSWFIAQSPAGWLTNNDQMEVLFYVDENLLGVDAQQGQIRVSPQAYDTDGVVSAPGTASIDWDDTGGSAVQVANGDFVEFSDGVNPAVRLEFNTGVIAETDTLRRIDFSGAADHNDVRDLYNAALAAVPTLATVATNGAGAGETDLTQLVQGTGGNVAITSSFASGNVTVDASFAGGSNGSRPTAIGAESTANASGDDIIPWAAPSDGLYSTWYTTRGDVMFGVKRRGQNFFTHFFMLYSNDDDVDQGGGGQGDHRWCFFSSSSATLNALDVSRWTSSTYWRGATPPGTAIATAMLAASSPWVGTTSWTNGVNNQGQIYDVPADLWVNTGTGLSPRYMGQLVDIYATPDNLPFGQLDDSERTQTQRRVAMGAGVAIYAPSADLPFL